MDVVKSSGVEGPVVCAVLQLAVWGCALVMGTDSNPRRPTCNFRLGGTHVGWMAEMSVPVTFAAGKESAKSLRRF